MNRRKGGKKRNGKERKERKGKKGKEKKEKRTKPTFPEIICSHHQGSRIDMIYCVLLSEPISRRPLYHAMATYLLNLRYDTRGSSLPLRMEDPLLTYLFT